MSFTINYCSNGSPSLEELEIEQRNFTVMNKNLDKLKRQLAIMQIKFENEEELDDEDLNIDFDLQTNNETLEKQINSAQNENDKMKTQIIENNQMKEQILNLESDKKYQQQLKTDWVQQNNLFRKKYSELNQQTEYQNKQIRQQVNNLASKCEKYDESISSQVSSTQMLYDTPSVINASLRNPASSICINSLSYPKQVVLENPPLQNNLLPDDSLPNQSEQCNDELKSSDQVSEFSSRELSKRARKERKKREQKQQLIVQSVKNEEETNSIHLSRQAQNIQPFLVKKTVKVGESIKDRDKDKEKEGKEIKQAENIITQNEGGKFLALFKKFSLFKKKTQNPAAEQKSDQINEKQDQNVLQSEQKPQQTQPAQPEQPKSDTKPTLNPLKSDQNAIPKVRQTQQIPQSDQKPVQKPVQNQETDQKPDQKQQKTDQKPLETDQILVPKNYNNLPISPAFNVSPFLKKIVQKQVKRIDFGTSEDQRCRYQIKMIAVVSVMLVGVLGVCNWGLDK